MSTQKSAMNSTTYPSASESGPETLAATGPVLPETPFKPTEVFEEIPGPHPNAETADPNRTGCGPEGVIVEEIEPEAEPSRWGGKKLLLAATVALALMGGGVALWSNLPEASRTTTVAAPPKPTNLAADEATYKGAENQLADTFNKMNGPEGSGGQPTPPGANPGMPGPEGATGLYSVPAETGAAPGMPAQGLPNQASGFGAVPPGGDLYGHDTLPVNGGGLNGVNPTATPGSNPAQGGNQAVGNQAQAVAGFFTAADQQRYLAEFRSAPMVVKVGGRGGHQPAFPAVGLPGQLTRMETGSPAAFNAVVPGQRVKARIAQKVLADDGSNVMAVLEEPLALGNEVLPVGTEVLGEVKGMVNKRIKIEFTLLRNGNRTWSIWAVAQDARDQADGVAAKQSPDVKPILNQVVRTGVQVIPVVGDKIAQAMNNGGYGNGYAAGGYYDQNGFGFGVNAYNQNGKSKNPNPFYYNGGQVYLLFKDATQRRPPVTPLAPVTPSFPQVNPYQTAGFPTQTIPTQFPGQIPGQVPTGYPTQFPAQPGFPNGGSQQPVQGYQPQPGGPQPVWTPAQPGIR